MLLCCIGLVVASLVPCTTALEFGFWFSVWDLDFVVYGLPAVGLYVVFWVVAVDFEILDALDVFGFGALICLGLCNAGLVTFVFWRFTDRHCGGFCVLFFGLSVYCCGTLCLV